MDNYFKNCPAKMNYGGLTDHRSSHTRELHNMNTAGMSRSDDFRLYAQQNAERIMDSQWHVLKTTQYCHNYQCFHNYGTNTTPQEHHSEMSTYNNVKNGQSQPPQCKTFADYRLTSTEGATY